MYEIQPIFIRSLPERSFDLNLEDRFPSSGQKTVSIASQERVAHTEQEMHAQTSRQERAREGNSWGWDSGHMAGER
jgi:hypothetical protein